MKQITLIAGILLSIACTAQKEKQTGTQSKIQTSQGRVPDSTFYIIGPSQNFKLLEKVIADPDNCTTNEKKAVYAWIANRIALKPADSTGKKNEKNR